MLKNLALNSKPDRAIKTLAPPLWLHHTILLLSLNVLKFLWMTKSFVAIFFAILLFLATMEADGKRMTLEKEREPSNHQLGRKAGIGAKDDMDLTGEDGSDIELIASKNRLIDSRHHIYMNDTSPIPRKHP
ncbi:hypothetical protein ERO13_A10G173500v2 [Gossypium hirsutum]|uniref:Uncharacterized protein n=1 Tax=Gossypium hirsutum TaxID=3635 RepID=A0A1U8IGS7_GOSHI|nr:uncharacterized protein LOC107896603 [Gossypium hirsutum]KAG4180579.1 hypothetical protein ERO13_A10G173500v2 [Gossypium hirsutum]